MTKDLVVVTGITGFVGIHAAVQALEAGYRVRGTLRREDQINRIKALPRVQPYLEDLEFAKVPNIGVENAYDFVLEGATYVLHIASPLPSEASGDFEEKVIKPAVQGTIGLLKTAQKVPTIKRIVITSSHAAIQPFSAFTDFENENITIYNEDSRVYDPPVTNSWDAYAASKALAFNATNDFLKDNKPHFDVITLLPGPVLGPGLLYSRAEDVSSGMNAYITSQIQGKDPRPPFPLVPIHVADLAKLHILALNSKIEGNQNFVCAYNGMSKVQWSEAQDVVKRHFSSEIEQGLFKIGEPQPTIDLLVDGSKLERVLGKTAGFEYKSYAYMVKDVAQQIVDLSK